MSKNHAILRAVRTFHLYSGIFLAPALLFFAFTGGMQTFSLHETLKGRDYTPPKILVTLGQLHKKQTIVVPVRRPPGPEPAKPAPVPAPIADPPVVEPPHVQLHTNQQKHDHIAGKNDEPSTKPAPMTSPKVLTPQPGPKLPPPEPTPLVPAVRVRNLWPMKIFFLIAALGLFCSTLSGLYMTYKFARKPTAITLTLLAGIVVPLLLLLF